MPHSLICGNILAALHRTARTSSCRIHQSDMRLSIDASSTYFYPDLMLVCDTAKTGRLAETAPCLLVEVLSPSTPAHDRMGKYSAYTAIPSLQTYLIVEQDERRVYAYQKDGEKWSLSLDEIYGGVLGS